MRLLKERHQASKRGATVAFAPGALAHRRDRRALAFAKQRFCRAYDLDLGETRASRASGPKAKSLAWKHRGRSVPAVRSLSFS
jgi:hypothetical protein